MAKRKNMGKKGQEPLKWPEIAKRATRIVKKGRKRPGMAIDGQKCPKTPTIGYELPQMAKMSDMVKNGW